MVIIMWFKVSAKQRHPVITIFYLVLITMVVPSRLCNTKKEIINCPSKGLTEVPIIENKAALTLYLQQNEISELHYENFDGLGKLGILYDAYSCDFLNFVVYLSL
eukprot:m.47516 g.47516  ORF g.47516 m.47516 type:complete len:105 (+) comp10509_c0_seq1:99-413(+)